MTTAQLSLDDALAARVRCHRQDPITSFHAVSALITSGQLNRQQGDALRRVRERPGLTSYELADGDLALRHRLNRRLPELVRMGLVVKGEARACRYAKGQSLTWWPDAHPLR
jgi:hypothetical protein